MPARWTVRAAALRSISENYMVLRDTFCLAQCESKDSKMRAVLCCAVLISVAYENKWKLLIGIQLGRMVLNMADNLSASLQGSSVSANEGQNLH